MLAIGHLNVIEQWNHEWLKQPNEDEDEWVIVDEQSY